MKYRVFGQSKPRFNVGPQRLDRRTLLRGVSHGLGLSVGLPVLNIMLNNNGNALAQTGEALPMRFGTFYWGGGVVHGYYTPQATGAGWQMTEILQPFAGIKPYTTIVSGYSHTESSPGHIPARGIVLSSSHDLTVCQGDCVGVYRSQSMPEPSLDALVAEHWSGKTRFDSIEVGICRKGPYKSNSSWRRGGNVYNRHEPSPKALFDRLFAGTLPTSGAGFIETTNNFQTSMLDAVRADAESLANRLGAADKMRMEAHLDGIRSLEQRLQQQEQMPPPAASACDKPDAPPASNFGDGGSREEKESKSKLMSELLAMATACDLTRIFSYEWSATQSQSVYWEVGNNEEHHEWNHRAGASLEYARSIQFIMKNYAYLGEQLRNMPEGDGNVLDRTLIFGTSEHASAYAHNYRDHPIVLMGKAGGNIRAGIHHRRQGNVANSDAPKVMLSAVRAVGVNISRLGQDAGEPGRVATSTVSDIMT